MGGSSGGHGVFGISTGWSAWEKSAGLKLRSLIASLMNLGILLLEELDPDLIDYLGGQELDWETLKREAGTQVLIKGINRAAA